MNRPLIGLNVDVAGEGELTLHRLRRQYVDALCEAGGLPLLVPAMDDPAIIAEAAARCDGFVFTGSKDYPPESYGVAERHPQTDLMHPLRAAADPVLARAVIARGIPILGICGGCQLLSIALGGRLVQHVPVPENHGKETRHGIRITGGRVLRGILGAEALTVNSLHHQAVDAAAPGRGLEVVAVADDGTVEAVESIAHRFLLGLQWHPERMAEGDHRRRVFGALLAACRQPA